MTAVCPGGGTSSAKAGYGATLALTSTAIAALFNNIPTPWAVPFAAFLGLATYELANFCPADPPAVPTITAADLLAIINPLDPIGKSNADAKLFQLAAAYLWYEVCQCDTGATPSPPAPPAAPTGAPSIDPPGFGGLPAAPCYSRRATVTRNYGNTLWHPVTADLLPVTTLVAVPAGIMAGAHTAYVIPSDLVGTTFTLSGADIGDGVNERIDLAAEFFNAAGTYIGNQALGVYYGGMTHFITVTPTAGAYSWNILANNPSALYAGSVDVDLRFICAPTAPVIAQPCCPPDPQLVGILNNILGIVTLIQRQAVPFAYVVKATHAGLTGNGHIVVEGLVGAKVTITSAGPDYLAEYNGDPFRIRGAGRLTWGSDDASYQEAQFLESFFTLSLPGRASAFTRLGYSLTDGITISIDELAREP